MPINLLGQPDNSSPLAILLKGFDFGIFLKKEGFLKDLS